MSRKKSSPKISRANPLVAKFALARPTFEAFTSNIEQLLRLLLTAHKIEFLSIETRTKTIDSFTRKLERQDKEDKYKQIHDMTDLSGLRIVAYYQKDVDVICKIVEDNFSIDKENSTDKVEILAPDRFGYLSIHYIVSLNKDRETLAEYKAFKSLKAEVQIRTVLQHAWAVIDRKLRYNQEEDIPSEVRRKLFRIRLAPY
jgi:ppGpp synthetase/RelA/SpoT-type nucleotidyltranferase